MKNIFLIGLVLVVLQSCKTISYSDNAKGKANFTAIKMDTLFQDKISIRAILFDENKIWFAGNKGRFGFYDLEKNRKFESKIINDTLPLEFRSIGKTAKNIFTLSVGNPALLYKISKDGKKTQLVYQENDAKVFYDSMQFWNDTEGIAIGDPTNDCISILITRDGGNSWQKIPSYKLPK